MTSATRQRIEYLTLDAHERYERGPSEGWAQVPCDLCGGDGRTPLNPHRPSVTVTCGRCLGHGHCYERTLDMHPAPAHDTYAYLVAASRAPLVSSDLTNDCGPSNLMKVVS